MTNPSADPFRLGVRACGIAGATSAALGVVAAIVTISYPKAVGDDRWSYPFTYSGGLAMGFALAAVHVLTLAGFLGVRQLAAGWGRAAAAGIWLNLVGLLALAGCEIAGGFIGRAKTDDSTAGVVDGAFAVASLLAAIGAIVLGVVLLRRRLWTPQGSWAILLSGITIIVLVSPANISGNLYLQMGALIVWSLCFAPLGMALVRESATRQRLGPSPATPSQLTTRA